MKKDLFNKIKSEMLGELRKANLCPASKSISESVCHVVRPEKDVEMMSAEDFFRDLDD